MKAEYHILFPFYDIKKDSKIVIYGAGDIGQTFYWQISCTGYCEVVGWIDQRWENEDKLAFPMCHIDDLQKIKFDYLIIAVKNEGVVREIKEKLEGKHISVEKIYYSLKYVHEYSLCGLNAGKDTSFSFMLAQAIGAKSEPSYNNLISKVAEKEKNINKVKIGFLTAGNMAEVMASTIKNRLPKIGLEAVASRNIQKAKRFADAYGVKKYYDSYQKLVEDPEIDIIYVASPAAMHYEHVMLCLQFGKHVLCEKPFALCEKQAREMIAIAESKNLLLADGLWTSYLPLAKKIKEVVLSGIIGNICTVSANSYYYSLGSPRIDNNKLGGGALLECGIYLLSFTILVLGIDVERIVATGLVNENGIDIQDNITLYYGNKMATLSCGIQGVSDRRGYIYGDKGYIEINDANEYRKISVYNLQGEIIDVYEMDGGYQYEILSCMKALKNRNYECVERKHDEIIGIMKIADEIRRQIGVVYK